MKYLIIALINSIYGILLLVTLNRDTPGFYLIVFIGLVLTILGLVGFSLWLWETISAKKDADQSIILKNWFQIAKGIDILLVLGLLFRSFILQPFLVEGNSMQPNYHNKEFLLVDRLSYKINPPKRGEVIIFRYPLNPADDYIKRIVGLPGETIKIENGQVFINDQLLEENYLSTDTQTFVANDLENFLEKTLAENEYFVLGDNRNNSSDSREWGIVPKNNLIGRAWFVVYPLEYFGKIKNPVVQFEDTSLNYLNYPSKSLTSRSLVCWKCS